MLMEANNPVKIWDFPPNLQHKHLIVRKPKEAVAKSVLLLLTSYALHFIDAFISHFFSSGRRAAHSGGKRFQSLCVAAFLAIWWNWSGTKHSVLVVEAWTVVPCVLECGEWSQSIIQYAIQRCSAVRAVEVSVEYTSGEFWKETEKQLSIAAVWLNKPCDVAPRWWTEMWQAASSYGVEVESLCSGLPQSPWFRPLQPSPFSHPRSLCFDRSATTYNPHPHLPSLIWTIRAKTGEASFCSTQTPLPVYHFLSSILRCLSLESTVSQTFTHGQPVATSCWRGR